MQQTEGAQLGRLLAPSQYDRLYKAMQHEIFSINKYVVLQPKERPPSLHYYETKDL